MRLEQGKGRGGESGRRTVEIAQLVRGGNEQIDAVARCDVRRPLHAARVEPDAPPEGTQASGSKPEESGKITEDPKKGPEGEEDPVEDTGPPAAATA